MVSVVFLPIKTVSGLTMHNSTAGYRLIKLVQVFGQSVWSPNSIPFTVQSPSPFQILFMSGVGLNLRLILIKSWMRFPFRDVLVSRGFFTSTVLSFINREKPF